MRAPLIRGSNHPPPLSIQSQIPKMSDFGNFSIYDSTLSWTNVDFKITIYEQWTSHFEKNREKNEEFLSERQGCFLPINWEQWYKYCCDINMEFRSGSFQIFGFKYLEVRLEPGFNMNLQNHIHRKGPSSSPASATSSSSPSASSRATNHPGNFQYEFGRIIYTTQHAPLDHYWRYPTWHSTS